MEKSHIIGCLMGTAVGDALGLPYENVSRQRSPRLLGPPDRHRFLGRFGMLSDDTEHTCMVAQALIASHFDCEKFTHDLAGRMRWWFASLPAGIGRATFRACLKLWLGAYPASSGVFSAGNGPAMRSAIFGAVFDDVDTMLPFVVASSRMTHSDPKAEFGAIAIALAAFTARQSSVDGEKYVDQLATIVGGEGKELTTLLRNVVSSVAKGESTLDYAAGCGCENGVSGYTYHTVPVAIHAWLTNPADYRAAVTSAIGCGGDADTTAAIVGGIIGAANGPSSIPEEWVSNIRDWPRSVHWIQRLADQLYKSSTDGVRQQPIKMNVFAALLRNLFFLVVVLCHGFRRLFPPY